MTNEEIFLKAVHKAHENGLTRQFTEEKWDELNMKDFWLDTGNSYYRIIYSHGFAKAFFGDNNLDVYLLGRNGNEIVVRNWQYHLQQLVLEEDPIRYLEQFI